MQNLVSGLSEAMSFSYRKLLIPYTPYARSLECQALNGVFFQVSVNVLIGKPQSCGDAITQKKRKKNASETQNKRKKVQGKRKKSADVTHDTSCLNLIGAFLRPPREESLSYL